jgi:hypothetical protein
MAGTEVGGTHGTADIPFAPPVPESTQATGLKRIPPKFRAIGGVAIFVVVATLTFLSSSHSSSKISQSDLDRLNAVNAQQRAIESSLSARLGNCLLATDQLACEGRVVAKAQASIGSAASVYQQVAAHTKGDCRAALDGTVTAMRAFAKSGSTSAADRLPGLRKQILSACHLKIKPTLG